MLVQLWDKIKEALVSVLPVSLIVLILSFTPLVNLTTNEIIMFVVCAIVLIVGIALFNLGADMAMTPMGEKVGSSLTKTKKISIMVAVAFVMGLLITIAEPDLSVLASQVSSVLNPNTLIYSIGLGVGIFLVLSVLKIVFKKDLSMMLMFFYMLMFAVTCIVISNGNGSFLALSFDSGGVTTGPITVPFIMALGVGIASTIGGRNSKENSFGLIALCSIGPILTVLLLGMGIDSSKLAINPNPSDYSIAATLTENIDVILHELLLKSKEVIIALALIVAFFLVIQFIFIKLPKKKLLQIFIGIAYTFIGLVLFLTAASVGYLPIGYQMGSQLASHGETFVIVFGFILGLVVVLAEPAVHVLTKQVEEITTGGVSKKAMLLALSIGVGISLGLSMIRIVFNFSILYYIIPGYFISLGLSFFVPKMYTAIAFDSGGVASGPLTSSFILPFAIGTCAVIAPGTVLENAFGIVAMVAMTPLITIQLLGFKSIVSKKAKEKILMKKIIDANDEQIINFM